MPSAGSSPVLIYTVAGVAIVLRFAFRELRDRKMRLGRLFLLSIVFGVIALLLVGAAIAVAPQAGFHLTLAVVIALLFSFAIGSGVGHLRLYGWTSGRITLW